MENSLLLVAGANLAACVYVGYLAQAERGHIGAVWGLVTFALSLPMHSALSYAAWRHAPELVLLPNLGTALTVAHVLALLLLSQAMAFIVWTLPNRKGA